METNLEVDFYRPPLPAAHAGGLINYRENRVLGNPRGMRVPRLNMSRQGDMVDGKLWGGPGRTQCTAQNLIY